MYISASTIVPEALDERHPVAVFRRVFSFLTPDHEMPLEELYAPDIRFEDPIHQLEGLEQVRHYFARLNAGLVTGEWRFGDGLIGETAAMLPWTMHLKLRQLRNPVVVAGCSHLRYHVKVTHHRDYFDVGALVYEQVPLLGTIVRRIKAAI
jgi:hypothetical protein